MLYFRSTHAALQILTLRSTMTYYRFALFTVFILGLGTPEQLTAQAETPQSVMFGIDYEAWSIFDGEPYERLAKVATLRGIFDGLMFGRSPMMMEEKGPRTIYTATSLTNWAAAVDQFYADYRNRQIFLVFAMPIISMEMQGASSDEVDAALRAERRRAAEIHESLRQDGRR